MINFKLQAQRQALSNKKLAEERPELIPESTVPQNYITPAAISAITSVKTDKIHFDKVVARTIMNLMINGDDRTKLAAIREYKELIKSQTLLMKTSDNTKIAVDLTENQNIIFDLSKHGKSDQPAEDFSKVESIDLLKDFRDEHEKDLKEKTEKDVTHDL